MASFLETLRALLGDSDAITLSLRKSGADHLTVIATHVPADKPASDHRPLYPPLIVTGSSEEVEAALPQALGEATAIRSDATTQIAQLKAAADSVVQAAKSANDARVKAARAKAPSPSSPTPPRPLDRVQTPTQSDDVPDGDSDAPPAPPFVPPQQTPAAQHKLF